MLVRRRASGDHGGRGPVRLSPFLAVASAYRTALYALVYGTSKGYGLLGAQVYAREATTQLSTRSSRTLIVVADQQGRFPAVLAHRATCAEHRRPCEDKGAGGSSSVSARRPGRPHTLQDDFARAAALHAALLTASRPW